MSKHRITIDTTYVEQDENGFTGECTCGEKSEDRPTWDLAYDEITAHVYEQGIPDSEIVLPETPEWLEDEAQRQIEANAR